MQKVGDGVADLVVNDSKQINATKIEPHSGRLRKGANLVGGGIGSFLTIPLSVDILLYSAQWARKKIYHIAQRIDHAAMAIDHYVLGINHPSLQNREGIGALNRWNAIFIARDVRKYMKKQGYRVSDDGKTFFSEDGTPIGELDTTSWTKVRLSQKLPDYNMHEMRSRNYGCIVMPVSKI